MKKKVILCLISLLSVNTAFSQNILTNTAGDTIVVITQKQLQTINQIFLEHQKLLKTDTIYKKEINNYKQIVTNDQKIDSLRVETIKVVKEDLKQTKKSLKKSKILNGVFGISTLALIIINIL